MVLYLPKWTAQLRCTLVERSILANFEASVTQNPRGQLTLKFAVHRAHITLSTPCDLQDLRPTLFGGTGWPDPGKPTCPDSAAGRPLILEVGQRGCQFVS